MEGWKKIIRIGLVDSEWRLGYWNPLDGESGVFAGSGGSRP